MRITGGQIMTIDGKVIGTVESATFKATEADPPARPVNLGPISGTLHFKKVPKAFGVSALGAKAKRKKATTDRLLRMGMTRTQARAWMH